MKSADSCRKQEIEGVGTVELVCGPRPLRMGGESLLVLARRSVGSGFTGKGEFGVCVVRAVT